MRQLKPLCDIGALFGSLLSLTIHEITSLLQDIWNSKHSTTWNGWKLWKVFAVASMIAVSGPLHLQRLPVVRHFTLNYLHIESHSPLHHAKAWKLKCLHFLLVSSSSSCHPSFWPYFVELNMSKHIDTESITVQQLLPTAILLLLPKKDQQETLSLSTEAKLVLKLVG